MAKLPKNVKWVKHPIIQHHLTFMRDHRVPNGRFRQHLKSVTRALFYEAMSEVKGRRLTGAFETPDGKTGEGKYLDSSQYALIAIMRSGVGMMGAVHDTLEEAGIGHAYYEDGRETGNYGKRGVKLPKLTSPQGDDRFIFIFDSGIVSGGTVIALLKDLIEERGKDPANIVVITATATHWAIDKINAAFASQKHPIRIYTAAVDEWDGVDEFPTPGMGSMRERLYGPTEED